MTKTLGMKFDSEKPRMGLLPPYALESVADVLTFGAKKYLPHNWKYVEGGKERYLDAALRHLSAYMKGEINDPESGLPHLSHALCCLMFIVDLCAMEDKKASQFTQKVPEKSEAQTPQKDWPFAKFSEQKYTEVSDLGKLLRAALDKASNDPQSNPYTLHEVMNFWKAN